MVRTEIEEIETVNEEIDEKVTKKVKHNAD